MWIHEEGGRVRRPAIIVEWMPIKEVNGYPFWLAKCLYWLDGEAKVTVVPARDVLKA